MIGQMADRGGPIRIKLKSLKIEVEKNIPSGGEMSVSLALSAFGLHFYVPTNTHTHTHAHFLSITAPPGAFVIPPRLAL